MTASAQRAHGIAIVGMAGHFPGARDVSELWSILKDGREATAWLSDAELMAAGVTTDELADSAYVKAAMILDDLENFDAEFFGFSPREASIMDPQHRHFLECCWEALEDAGRPPSTFSGAIGVFGGCGPQTYYARNLLPNAELVRSVGHFLLRHTGNDKDFLTTRVSYLLNLRGPSIGIQTACSTSLVAVHMACQSLYAGECDMALAGGASIELPHRTGYIAAEGEILSPNGRCAAFDDAAAGTIFGSGAGVVALRRLDDALADGDNIHAVILGSAVNNDGAGKAGYFAPSVDGQASAAAEAVAVAGVEPSSIRYIEAHGTGTVIGDPIELAALREVYASRAAIASIGVGSIKTNIGHLDTAAGVASLIKVVLALKHQTLPASLHFKTANRRFRFAESSFYVVAETVPWASSGMPRRASVNSLGVGGTNAHLVVEEPPAFNAPPTPYDSRQWQLFTISAKSPSSLNALAQKWRTFAANPNPNFTLADAAFTSQVGRTAFQHRLVAVARTDAELAQALASAKAPHQSRCEALKTPPGVVFMFPGGGAQYPGCANALYRENAVFRVAADECFSHVPPELADLKSIMFGEAALRPGASERLAQPLNSIVAVLIIEVALARMWQSFGVAPVAVIGNSAGDYAAAVVAGILRLEDAVKIVMRRGAIFAAMPPGAMLAVHVTEDRLRELAGENLDIAVLNTSSLGVVSGSVEAIEAVRARLDADRIDYSRIRIDVAAHSRMLDPFLPEFREWLKHVRFSDPKIPFVSCLADRADDATNVATPEYWVRQLRDTVRFHDGMSAILEQPGRVLLEVGPGRSLSPLAAMAKAKHAPHIVIASTRSALEADDDIAVATLAAGQLWAAGVDVDLAAVRGPQHGRLIPAPTYAFDRKRHWIDAPPVQLSAERSTARATTPEAEAPAAIARLNDASDWVQIPVWREQLTPPPATSARYPVAPNALVFSDRSPLAAELIAALKRRGSQPVIVQIGDQLVLEGACEWRIDPANEQHYAKLMEALPRHGAELIDIFHLWSLDGASAETGTRHASMFTTSFDSLFLLMRAIQLLDCAAGVRIQCVTTGAVAAVHDDVIYLPNSTLVGPVRVWGREAQSSAARLIDIVQIAGDEKTTAQRILAEVDGGASDVLVALRGDQRRVLRFERAPDFQSEPAASRIVKDGVYIITGGTGSLGLLLAKHLVAKHSARVALIARREYHAALPNDIAKNAIVKVADVTDEASMARAIAETRTHFGKLNGVIHAAGVVDDAPIGAKTLADTHRVLAAKVTGGMILDRLLPAGSIDIFAVFSSTSALFGPPGQIDYVAANAFLDALAANRPDGLAIDWGLWGDVGMATRLRPAEQVAPSHGESAPSHHALLGISQTDRIGERTYESVLDPSALWMLAEHTIGDVPVLPGTAYLECAREAMTRVFPAAQYALMAVAFVSPLIVMPGSKRRMRTCLREIRPALWSISISSLSERSDQEDLHFTCEATAIESASSIPAPAICRGKSQNADAFIAQRSALKLGPRWQNIQSLRIGANVVQATLEVGQAFAGDANLYALHPALLDMAMTIGLHLATAKELAKYLFVPASIGVAKLLAPLHGQIIATCQVSERQPGKSLNFSVIITSARGDTLVTLSELEMRAVDRKAFATAPILGAPAPHSPLAALLLSGFRSEDAPHLFSRAFEVGPTRRVLSSIALAELECFYSRPQRSTIQVRKAPKTSAVGLTETEQKIAAMFTELLGVEDIQPDDGFLALGGHSLAAVRLFAKIRKQFDVDLGIATLFQAPSVRELASLIGESGTAVRGAAAATERLSTEGHRDLPNFPEEGADRPTLRGQSAIAASPLVRISNGQAGRRPLFCIHGAGGNVASIYPLADNLRQHHTVFGVQAHGVDGRVAPLEKIEDMAATYLAAIREVDPVGPFCLVGYSGGGVIAYEMAQQIRASGQKIALLTMIDTLAPASASDSRLLNWLYYGWDNGPIRLATQARRGLHRRINELAKRWYSSQLRRGPIDPILTNADRVFAAYLRAQRRYYTLPYPGEILLFKAENTGVGYYAAGATLGWGKFVDHRVEVHELHATHETIVQQPSAQHIARILDAKLQSINQQRNS